MESSKFGVVGGLSYFVRQFLGSSSASKAKGNARAREQSTVVKVLLKEKENPLDRELPSPLQSTLTRCVPTVLRTEQRHNQHREESQCLPKQNSTPAC